MGFTHVEVTVINAATASKQDVELLVDNGALLTAVPRKILESLRITPIGKRTLRLFGGQIVEREIGAAIIKYKEAMAGITVIFAEKTTPRFSEQQP
jgi:predicted aspartyl protease